MSYQFSISDIGLRLIKAYEGFWPEARPLASGGYVVGFGHRLEEGEDEAVSEEEAEELLKADLAPVEDFINSRVHASMTQSQFDALCSLIFSVGEEAFLASDMLHDLNRGQVIEASNGFDKWLKGNIGGQVYVVDALVRRRTAEKALFLRPTQRVARAPRFELASIREHKLIEVTNPDEKSEAEILEEIAETNSADLSDDLDVPIIVEAEPAVIVDTPEIEIPEDDSKDVVLAPVLLKDDQEDQTDDAKDTTLKALATPLAPVLYSDDVEDNNNTMTTEPVMPLTVIEQVDVPEVEETASLQEDVITAPVLTVIETDQTGTTSEDVIETVEPTNFVEDIKADVQDLKVEVKDQAQDIKDSLAEEAAIIAPKIGSEAKSDETEKKTEIEIVSEDTVTPPPREETSPIAAAAAEVSDRLDALIEDKPEEPKAEVSETNDNSNVTRLNPPAKAQNEIIIDELQQDDALREQIARESQYNTNRYDDYVEVEDEGGNRGILAFGIMILVGLTSAIAGLVVNLQGSTKLLGENGPFIAVAAMLIGGLLVVVGLMYMMKAIFTRD